MYKYLNTATDVCVRSCWRRSECCGSLLGAVHAVCSLHALREQAPETNCGKVAEPSERSTLSLVM